MWSPFFPQINAYRVPGCQLLAVAKGALEPIGGIASPAFLADQGVGRAEALYLAVQPACNLFICVGVADGGLTLKIFINKAAEIGD